jgi:preprotein translocase subunit SecY
LTSGLITSFMSSASFLNFDDKKTQNMSANDKKKREKKIQKFFGIVLCFFQASAYVLSGMYGKFEDLGSGNATMIVMQVM